MFDQELFDDARREFLSHLRYAKGHRPTTCYAYNSDLGIWGAWLVEAGKDWQTVKYPDVEQFAAWQSRDRGVSPAMVNRRLSALSTFYRWLMRGGIVEQDPVALAQKPKRPLRIPVWLEREEQAQLGDWTAAPPPVAEAPASPGLLRQMFFGNLGKKK